MEPSITTGNRFADWKTTREVVVTELVITCVLVRTSITRTDLTVIKSTFVINKSTYKAVSPRRIQITGQQRAKDVNKQYSLRKTIWGTNETSVASWERNVSERIANATPSDGHDGAHARQVSGRHQNKTVWLRFSLNRRRATCLRKLRIDLHCRTWSKRCRSNPTNIDQVPQLAATPPHLRWHHVFLISFLIPSSGHFHYDPAYLEYGMIIANMSLFHAPTSETCEQYAEIFRN